MSLSLRRNREYAPGAALAAVLSRRPYLRWHPSVQAAASVRCRARFNNLAKVTSSQRRAISGLVHRIAARLNPEATHELFEPSGLLP